MNRKSTGRPASDPMAGSRILSALRRLAEQFRLICSESFAGRLLSGDRRNSGSGIFTRLFNKLGFRRHVSIPVKRAIARTCERSFLLNFVKNAIGSLTDLPLRCVGIFFFSGGLCQIIFLLFRQFVMGQTDRLVFELTAGLAGALIGGILIASQKLLGEALCRSRFFSFFLFRVLGLREEVLARRTDRPVGRGDVSFFLGVSVGAFGIATGLPGILLMPILIGLLCVVLYNPESGVILLLLSWPFLPLSRMVFLCCFVVVCWFLKLLRGKRTLATASLDIAVLSFAFLLLLAGMISITPSESLRSAGLLIVLTSGYFLTVNLIRTTEWVKRSVGALLFSFGFLTVTGILRLLLRTSVLPLPGLALPAALTDGIASFAGSSLSLEGLLPLIPLAAVARMTSHSSDSRLGYRILGIAAVLLLIFSRSGSLRFAGTIILLLSFFLGIRSTVSELLTGAILLPALFFLRPLSARLPFLAALLPASENAFSAGVSAGWNRLVREVFAGGIGLGQAAFDRVYPLFVPTSSRVPESAYGLYDRLIIASGLPLLLVFLVLFLIFLRHCFSYFSNARNDDPTLRYTVAAGFSGIFGLLILGLTQPVWDQPRLYFLFWLVLGLTSAAIRTGTRERITERQERPFLELNCSRAASRAGRKDR